MEVIIEEGICTLCGRRTRVALLECWEDQDRGVVEMNVTLCATCLTHILQRMEGNWRNKDGKEGGGMFTDLELIAYKKQRKAVKNFFENDLGYLPDRYVNVMFGSKRNIFYHPKGYFYVDVFFSKLEFSHDVYFGEEPGKGRLELEYPTITLADVVLEKLQIHEINRKDLIDLTVLFLGHELSEEDKRGFINAKYIARVLADDWGFWYDAVNNLNKVKLFVKKATEEGKIKKDESETIIARIDRLLEYIDKEPKTKNWVKRSTFLSKSKILIFFHRVNLH